MLPFMEAGGAISGANFGMWYTVMMQLGYNKFGKEALQRLEKGEPLQDILLSIQKEMAPFNEKIVQIAFDHLPSILDKTINIIVEIGQEKWANAMRNFASGAVTDPLVAPFITAEKNIQGEFKNFVDILVNLGIIPKIPTEGQLAEAYKLVPSLPQNQPVPIPEQEFIHVHGVSDTHIAAETLGSIAQPEQEIGKRMYIGVKSYNEGEAKQTILNMEAEWQKIMTLIADYKSFQLKDTTSDGKQRWQDLMNAQQTKANILANKLLAFRRLFQQVFGYWI